MVFRRHAITGRVLAMKFASEFMLIYPLATIMFQQKGGVDAAGVGQLLAAGFVLSVLLEVPTGILADKIARKYVLLLAYSARALGLWCWLAFPSFSGYLIAAFWFALAEALESGALQAYLYNTLGSRQTASFGKVWARVSAMIMISYTVAYASATLIGPDYDVLLSLSLAACLFAVIIALTLPTDKLPMRHERPALLRTALRHLRLNHIAKSQLFAAVLIIAISMVAIEYLPLYLQENTVLIRYIPIILAISNTVGAILFWTMHRFEAALERNKLALTLVGVLVLLMSSLGGTVVASLGVLVFVRYVRLLQVQFDAQLQHSVDNEARATITSVVSLVSKLLAGLAFVGIGLSAQSDDIKTPFLITLVGTSLIYCLMLALPYLFTRSR